MKINEGTGVLLNLFLQVIYVHVITSCSKLNTLKKLLVFIQSMNRLWIDRNISWTWEVNWILNRWELLLAWMACEMFRRSVNLSIACLGAITVPWSLLNGPLIPIVAVCSLTHERIIVTWLNVKYAKRKNMNSWIFNLVDITTMTTYQFYFSINFSLN